ncbi:unnamed protein product [Protopolystoma xenopodis]|uniref:Uncharacterized protein n=1 Tax=Protopolystoma xenopodis TaxID=117903 RepID=A0A3S5C5J0_9PLAT|nr:unnamed protein product [Protopolystoma xenopodis]
MSFLSYFCTFSIIRCTLNICTVSSLDHLDGGVFSEVTVRSIQLFSVAPKSQFLIVIFFFFTLTRNFLIPRFCFTLPSTRTTPSVVVPTSRRHWYRSFTALLCTTNHEDDAVRREQIQTTRADHFFTLSDAACIGGEPHQPIYPTPSIEPLDATVYTASNGSPIHRLPAASVWSPPSVDAQHSLFEATTSGSQAPKPRVRRSRALKVDSRVGETDNVLKRLPTRQDVGSECHLHMLSPALDTPSPRPHSAHRPWTKFRLLQRSRQHNPSHSQRMDEHYQSGPDDPILRVPTTTRMLAQKTQQPGGVGDIWREAAPVDEYLTTKGCRVGETRLAACFGDCISSIGLSGQPTGSSRLNLPVTLMIPDTESPSLASILSTSPLNLRAPSEPGLLSGHQQHWLSPAGQPCSSPNWSLENAAILAVTRTTEIGDLLGEFVCLQPNRTTSHWHDTHLLRLGVVPPIRTKTVGHSSCHNTPFAGMQLGQQLLPASVNPTQSSNNQPIADYTAPSDRLEGSVACESARQFAGLRELVSSTNAKLDGGDHEATDSLEFASHISMVRPRPMGASLSGSLLSLAPSRQHHQQHHQQQRQHHQPPPGAQPGLQAFTTHTGKSRPSTRARAPCGFTTYPSFTSNTDVNASLSIASSGSSPTIGRITASEGGGNHSLPPVAPLVDLPLLASLTTESVHSQPVQSVSSGSLPRKLLSASQLALHRYQRVTFDSHPISTANNAQLQPDYDLKMPPVAKPRGFSLTSRK